MMISSKIISFRDDIDNAVKASSTTFRDYIEDAFQISKEDNYNISILKFYVENEDCPERDDALKFLNLLQDSYDGRTLDLGAITKIQELYTGVADMSARLNIRDMLLRNAGISVGVLDEAWIEDNNLCQKSSSVCQAKDFSISAKITSYEALKNFQSIVRNKYGFTMTKPRVDDINSKVEAMYDAEFEDNTIVCIARINNNVARYTILGESFEENVPPDEPFLKYLEYSYEEVLYDVWVL